MKEVRKNRSQEVKQETNKPSPLVGERIYGRTSETSPDCEQIEQAVAIATFAKLCERGVNSRQGRVRGNCGLPRPHFVRPRNDETTCHPELVSGSSYNEILKPLQEDPFCTKSVDFGKRRQVQNDMARSNQTAVWDDIEGRHCERSAAIQKKQAPTLTLPQKGGDKNSFPNEGRSEWVPINNVNSLTSCLPDIWISKKKTAVAKSSKKVAFTLAEVLITLGIIGVVAAMTMPALITKHQKQVTVTRLKRNYSVIQNAINAMIAENDGVPLTQMDFCYQKWNHPNFFDRSLFIPQFEKHLKFIQSEEAPANFEKNYKNVPGNNNVLNWGIAHHIWTMEDGSWIAIWAGTWTWGEDAHIKFVTDIDGIKKGQNREGRDLFEFELLPSGKVIPMYSDSENGCTGTSWNSCIRGRAGTCCAKKIMDDGWEIKDDYPW